MKREEECGSGEERSITERLRRSYELPCYVLQRMETDMFVKFGEFDSAEEEPEEAGGQDAETAEGVSQESEQIMPEPVEKEPIAPAQKPAESETYKDAKSMLKGIEEAFMKKDWDRVLHLMEGLEPAIRKLKKEER